MALMTAEHKKKLTKNRVQLVENINIAAIMNDIVAEEVLHQVDISTIKYKQIPTEKIECLLDSLPKRPDECYYKFIDILRNYDHGGLANLLDDRKPAPTNSAGQQAASVSANERSAPMSRVHKDRLTVNRDKFIDILNVAHLTGSLLAKRIITDPEKAKIDACDTPFDKNDKFLGQLNGKTEGAFYDFIDVLKEKSHENPIYNWMVEQLQDQ